MTRITPLEAWIREKAHIHRDATGRRFVEALKDYQIRKVNETIDYARHNAPFYRRNLASIPANPLSTISDIRKIPFTTPADLAKDPLSFLAVHQHNVARVVTLRVPGSTEDPRRIFFTESDLELTVDFFHHGMSTLVRPGQRVAIFLPGERPYSVGDLLARGLQRLNVESLVYGPVVSPLHAAEAIASFGAHCLVGIPTQVLAVARSEPGAAIGKESIKSVLLTTDYVPRAVAETLEKVWGCRVFNHYGMTEMGLGGGVECEALDGYHLREADLYFEVVNHKTGEPCLDGEIGEVVFTTLTRQGMPLIRYRTGDIACTIETPCPCGTVLRRMAPIRGRWNDVVSLGPDGMLTPAEMDEALLRLPGLIDYRAAVSKGRDGIFHLAIDACRVEAHGPTEAEVLHKLDQIDAIQKGMASGRLATPTVGFSPDGMWTTTGISKRKITIVEDPRT